MRRYLWTSYFIIGFALTYFASSGFAISSTQPQCTTKECYFNEGEKLFDSGKDKPAIKYYDNACKLNHKRACYVQGYLNAKYKNFGLSLEAYKRACTLGLNKSCQKQQEIQKLVLATPVKTEKSFELYKALTFSSLLLSFLIILGFLYYQFFYKKTQEKNYRGRIQEEIKNAMDFLNDIDDEITHTISKSTHKPILTLVKSDDPI